MDQEIKRSPNRYLSIDFGLPEEHQALLTFADKVEATLLAAGMEKLRRTRDVHLTLAFIGRKEEPSLEVIDEVIKEVLSQLRPPIHEIWIDTDEALEVFGHAIVMMIDGEKNKQGRLHIDVLAYGLQYGLEQIGIKVSNYMPHLTLGRVNQRKMHGVAQVLAYLKPPPLRFTVKALTFHRGQEQDPLTYPLYPQKS